MARLLRKAKSAEVLKRSDESEVLVQQNLELRRIVADLLIQTTILREQLQAAGTDIEHRAKRVA